MRKQMLKQNAKHNTSIAVAVPGHCPPVSVSVSDLRSGRSGLIDRSGTSSGPDVLRTIRTCAPSTRAAHQPAETGLRLLSKVLRQVATAQRFTTYGELKEAFRAQLRQLRIRYQQHEFDDVFAIVGSNVRLVTLAAPAARAFHVEPERRGFSKTEAAAFMAQLPGLVKTIAPAFGKATA